MSTPNIPLHPRNTAHFESDAYHVSNLLKVNFCVPVPIETMKCVDLRGGFYKNSQKHTKTPLILTKTYQIPLCLTLRLSKIYQIPLCLTQTHKNIPNFTLSHTQTQTHKNTPNSTLTDKNLQNSTLSHKIPLYLTLRLIRTYKSSTQIHKNIQHSTLSHT